VLDESRSRLTMDGRSVIQAINIDHVWFLPGGMTSQLCFSEQFF
jgi:hypothetical protein